jgi:DNA-binding response OmpR family regulator
MQEPALTPPETLELGPVRVRLDRREVVRPDGTVTLTEVETRLLGYLGARLGVTVTRDQLLRDVWGYAPGLVTRAVHHAVTRLRKEVELDPSAPA